MNLPSEIAKAANPNGNWNTLAEQLRSGAFGKIVHESEFANLLIAVRSASGSEPCQSILNRMNGPFMFTASRFVVAKHLMKCIGCRGVFIGHPNRATQNMTVIRLLREIGDVAKAAVTAGEYDRTIEILTSVKAAILGDDRPPDAPEEPKPPTVEDRFAKECVREMNRVFGIKLTDRQARDIYCTDEQIRSDYETCGFDTVMRETVANTIGERITGLAWPEGGCGATKTQAFFLRLRNLAPSKGYEIDMSRYARELKD